jgi:hypothetical protein
MDEQRRLLRQAIVAKGLREGLKVYDSKKGWARNENNWNQVCNGGLLSGALAIADAEPQLASRIVSKAVQSVPLAMKHYAPDGAGDGSPNWQEVIAGADPTNAASFLRVTSVAYANPQGSFLLEWPSATNRTYRVFRSTYAQSGFQPVALHLPATPPLNTHRDLYPGSSQEVFYRLEVE